MSNYGKTKIITTHTDVRYPSVEAAMNASGYTRKGAVTSINPKDQIPITRDIYEDETGKAWGIVSSISYNYTVQEITLKQYTGTPENIK